MRYLQEDGGVESLKGVVEGCYGWVNHGGHQEGMQVGVCYHGGLNFEKHQHFVSSQGSIHLNNKNF